MNIFRPQTPYTFRPPRYSRPLAPLLAKVSEIFYLRKKFHTRAVTVEGVESVAKLVKHGHSLLIAPNHSDHADPHVLMKISRRHGLRFHFMAAREGFESSRLNAFVLQRCGAFSIDREGADVSAIKTAIQILQDGSFPLVIFPEGEIYHHQARLDPLNEGVATIVLRATNRLAEQHRSYLVPTTLKYSHDQAVQRSFSARLDALERRITWKPRGSMDAVERIYRLGGGLLAIKEVEFLGQVQEGDLIERIANLRNRLVEIVEQKHQQAGTGSIPERVKALRGRIRKHLTDATADLSAQQQADLYDDLDTLFMVVQLYSYPGQYLREDPGIDRIAETILKLEEDVLDEAKYPAPRDVHVHFDEPIDVKAFLSEHSLNAKSGVGPLTALLSNSIQATLER